MNALFTRSMSTLAALVLASSMLFVVGCSSDSGSQAPDPPTNVEAAAANASAKVSFTAPTDDGGSPISGYTASCTSTNSTTGAKAGPASPIVVPGLGNGHSYTCKVVANNASGTSVPSEPSNSFVPVGVPGAPTPASAVPYASEVALVAWKAPANTGGSPITGYVVTPYIGSVAQPVQTFDSVATTQQIKGLTNGRAYQFAIAARNKLGKSAVSTKTGVMTSGAPGQPGDAKAVKAQSGSLKVSFIAPANNGAEITSYTATCTATQGGEKKSKTGAGAVITLSDRALTVGTLTPGKPYTCTAKASNSRGVGPNSSPSPAAKA